MPATASVPLLWAEPFIPDDPPATAPLWAIEQRPWSAALAQHYIERLSRPGDTILDPFASQPAVIQAGASRRRIVANNAIPASLLAVMSSADPPGAAAVDAAFTRIADAPRRGQTLADHLQGLYSTVCPNCAGMASAESFVWDRAAGEPFLKQVACPHCHEESLASVDLEDISRLGVLEVRGAAYWGLLSRLVAPGDSQTQRARQLIDLYVPRTLLAINELITATEQRISDPLERRAARALVLHVLQASSTLHEADQAGRRTRLAGVLEPPRRFIEHNAWRAFEHAHRILRERPTHSVIWANDLVALRGPSGEGRVAAGSFNVPELAERLAPGSVSLILSEPPPFDPGAYLLGFLWTGWLLGREAASHSKAALGIERWSWDWYARAMATALSGLRPLIKADGHLVLAFSDSSVRRALALMTAAARAGWILAGQATQSPLIAAGTSAWRLVFTAAPPRPTNLSDEARPLHEPFRQAALALATLRGEPTAWPLVVTAGAARWAAEGSLAASGGSPDSQRRPVSTLMGEAQLALSADLPPAELRPSAGGRTETKQWELDEWTEQPPLADRVEQFVVAQLQGGPVAGPALVAAVYRAFPGWETPDAELVDACIASYAEQHDGQLRLRAEDTPDSRRRDEGEILLRLHALGRALGFEVWIAPERQASALGLVPVSRSEPESASQWPPANVVWHERGDPLFAFAVTNGTGLHPWLAQSAGPLEGIPRFVVLPGGRAELLDFKLRRCPAWRQQLAWSGWEFVKFRHIRRLAAMPDPTLANFRARIGMDPVVTLPGQQLALFEGEAGAGEPR